VTLSLAALSYRFVERPIRYGAFSASTLRWLTPASAAALVVLCIATTLRYAPPTTALQQGIVAPRRAARLASQRNAQRVMVAGNSVANMLAGEGLAQLVTSPPSVVLNRGRFSCTFPDADQARFGDRDAGHQTIHCTDGWRHDVATFRPDTVLLLVGDAGVTAYLYDGIWLQPCQAGFAPWYRRGLDGAVAQLGAKGARVVLVTAPYSRYWGPLEDQRRSAESTDCTNTAVYEYVSAHPAVGLVDLARFVCPTDFESCRTLVDGEPLRPDGVHFRGYGARYVSGWMLGQLGLTVVGEQPASAKAVSLR